MAYSHPIEPSNAFAELGRIMPGKTSLRDVFQRVVDLTGLSIPEVTEASVSLVQGKEAHTPACTGGLALALDESQYELGHGPCLQAAAATTIESITNMATESRWPDWTARALRAGAHSSLSIGLPIHATIGGALNLYATEPHAFDDHTIAVAQTFASYASLAIANDHLDNARTTLSRHIDAAMDSGAVIEQAKGIIMGDRRCTADEAFAVLTTTARNTTRTVRDVARTLVDRTAVSRAQVTGGP
ncbi:GAF and ANTAR domain-containing protein [Micromonospora sp. NPDC048905]|uniref:GAF domain-containing protein n=1 Tax=Micromonospora sp. NPDC048905 TaxID=3155494 RepID=UPI0033DE70E8